jgi:hypothetical protein
VVAACAPRAEPMPYGHGTDDPRAASQQGLRVARAHTPRATPQQGLRVEAVKGRRGSLVARWPWQPRSAVAVAGVRSW